MIHGHFPAALRPAYGVRHEINLLLTANVAHAQTGKTFIIGVGRNSCGQLIAASGKTPLGQRQEMDTESARMTQIRPKKPF